MFTILYAARGMYVPVLQRWLVSPDALPPHRATEHIGHRSCPPPRIDPLRAFVFFGAITLVVAYAVTECAIDFATAVDDHGLSMLAFLALPPTLGTVFLLRSHHTPRTPVPPFAVNLVLNIAISAAVFIAALLLLGEWNTLGEGLIFRGDRCWLGILFWSALASPLLCCASTASAYLLTPVTRLHTTVTGEDPGEAAILPAQMSLAIVVTGAMLVVGVFEAAVG